MQNNAITTGNENESIDLRHYWRVITRAKLSILIITTFFVFMSGLIVAYSTPIYEARTKILADPTPPNAAREEQYISSALVFLFFETQYEIIQSRAIAETVVDKLNLVERYKKEVEEKKLQEQGLLEKATTNIKGLIKKLIPSNENDKQTKNADVADKEIKIMLAKSIQGKLRVSGGKQSQVINISFESNDAVLARDIVNALSQAYIQFGLQSRLAEVKDTEIWLSEQSQELRSNLTDAEERLKTFRLLQGIVDSNQQQRDANSRMQSLNNQLINAQTKFGEAEETFRQIEGLSTNAPEFYSLRPVLENRTAGDLVKELSRQESNVSELEKRYKEKHPKMISARSELLSIQDSLSREIAKIVEQIKRNYKNAQQQVLNIENLILKERESIQALQGSTSQLMTLEREVENSRRIYESFMAKLMETNVKGEFGGSNISVIDYATTPQTPIKPRSFIIVVLSLIIGVVVSILYAIIKSALINSFTTTDAIEEELAIQALGITHALDKQELSNSIAELKYLENNRSVFAEGINTIRTAIQFSNIDNPPRTILITSSSGSEGKSTLATNLAAAYSQLGKTLLLEVDLRKPSMAKNLILSNEKGLTSIISKANTISESIIKLPNSEQLDVLISGPLPHNPIELLSSDTFRRLINDFKTEYDFVILDGPPSLPVSDSIIIGNTVDVVIMAVKAEETKISAAKETIKRLKKNNVNIIGCVLTMATPHKMSYYGEYYYGTEYYGATSS